MQTALLKAAAGAEGSEIPALWRQSQAEPWSSLAGHQIYLLSSGLVRDWLKKNKMGARKMVQWVKHLLSQILLSSILRTNSTKESSNLHMQNTNNK